MNKRTILIIAFSLSAGLQLAMPISMIARYELTLWRGEAFKFRAAPADPYDPFRGRFVDLRLEPTEAQWGGPDAESVRRDTVACGLLATNVHGFAEFSSILRSAPGTGAWLRVEVSHVDSAGRAHFRIPLDRFYMEEDLAPKAERIVRSMRTTNAPPIYALVRVRKGMGVIEDVYVGEKSLAQAAAEAEDEAR